MKNNMLLRFYQTGIALIILLLLFNQNIISDSNRIMRFVINNKDAMEVNIPESWDVKSRQANNLSLSLKLTHKGSLGKDGLFTLLITAFAQKKKPMTDSEIKELVIQNSRQFRSQAVENKIDVKELKTASLIGYYYKLTDKAPKPGEYKYMRQGFLQIEKVLLTFTFFFHQDEETEWENAISLFKSIKIVKTDI